LVPKREENGLNREDESTACMYYEETLAIFENIEDLSGQASYQCSIGTCYQMRGDCNAEMRFFQKAPSIASLPEDLARSYIGARI
jgi:hypothetical protein